MMPAKDDARRALIAEMHSQGMSDVQIGERLGVSKSAICHIRKDMGLPAVTRGGHKQLVTDADLIKWEAVGMSRQEMAERSGASRVTITKRLWELRKKEKRAAQVSASVVTDDEEDDEPTPTIIGDALFLSAFASVRVALPTNSRRAEISNRDGRLIGLPVMMSAPSSLCMGG
ncbi:MULTISPECIES: helix-turn-helix domain-containing protein [unclassified Azospirillum]|uniref:helix-turn-helix domain-containing protein n=1 Tax=unclassified Azospirillum TaxID=2630922 RepID=UPI000D65DB00|nr:MULTISPECIES: helix-turn-helix domain-containing protein [unclassified Azospirillum]